MLSRVIVLLLVVLNIGAAAWIASTYRPVEAPRDTADPGVPRLVLLSERDGSPSPEVPRGNVAVPVADLSCTSIGPFSNQADLRRAMAVLSPLTQRLQFRETMSSQSRGWWVYLPPFASREAAIDAARGLREQGVSDYYVITAGDDQNTVSLGLFRERANAEQRHAQLLASGLKPLVGERIEHAPAYWLDFAQRRDAPIDWRGRTGVGSDIGETTITCF